MNELSRNYLENLTTDEALALADRFEIEIPDDPAWNFVVEALLEIACAEQSEETLTDAPLEKAAPLPDRYNISFVDVLIRDPMWVFVFWEIKTQDRDAYENDPDFDGYYLKVCPQEDAKKSFTVSVKPVDNAWYVGIPVSEGKYTVELCALLDGKETALTASRVFSIPKLFDRKKFERSPLLELSGLDDLPILRNRERTDYA
jgi:hypothetical protein